VAPFVISGTGMALFFAPVANVVLSSVAPQHEGKASGATNAIRELGGVFGVAVLASVFAHEGGYRTADTFTHGTSTAVWIGGAVVALGAGCFWPSTATRRGDMSFTAPLCRARSA